MNRLLAWLASLFGGQPVPADAPVMPASPMLDCGTVMQQLWDYLDGELTPDRMTAIHQHLDVCKRCYPHLEFEKSFLTAVAAIRQDHSDPRRLRSRVSDALRAQGMTGDTR